LVSIAAGRVIGAVGSVSLAEVARVWYRAPQNLPDDANAVNDALKGLGIEIGGLPITPNRLFAVITSSDRG
jgi:hypothetical protein